MTATPLSLHALGPTPTTDEVDAVVHALIDRHFSGQMTEEQTRRQISGALYRSRIHEEVARGVTELSPQARNDLADRLLTLITDKMIDGGDFYNLRTGRGVSACGWARQFAKSVIASELRNHRRAENRNGTPLDPGGYEFSVLGQTSPSLIVWGADGATINDQVGDAVDAFTETTKGMRGSDRLRASGEALVAWLGVAPAVRPERMEDRDAALKQLLADDTLAHRSLREWRAIVSGSEAPISAVDEHITALWDDQDESSAETILRLTEEVAHTLALVAVSPMPRPAKKSLQRIKSLVTAASEQDKKAWRELASALVESYIASEFEAVSRYATMSIETREAAITGHKIARGRLDALLDRAAAFPGAPLGKTRSRVTQQLAAATSRALTEDSARARSDRSRKAAV